MQLLTHTHTQTSQTKENHKPKRTALKHHLHFYNLLKVCTDTDVFKQSGFELMYNQFFYFIQKEIHLKEHFGHMRQKLFTFIID